jgi:hypothetical protein
MYLIKIRHSIESMMDVSYLYPRGDNPKMLGVHNHDPLSGMFWFTHIGP